MNSPVELLFMPILMPTRFSPASLQRKLAAPTVRVN